MKGRDPVLPTAMNRGAVGAVLKRQSPVSENERRRAQAAVALQELFSLLEKYAPSWYTWEHHEKAESALRDEREPLASVFVELFDLIEGYAPVWYTKEDHEKAESVRQLLKQP